jgi:hypothetical protein
MQKIKKSYRADYQGEDIITNAILVNGQWQYEKEHIPTNIFNNQISNRALVIGNGLHRKNFNLDLVANHKGGLLGAGALQTYGCNALYRDFEPHFLVATGDTAFLTELANSGYCESHIVYANAQDIVSYPDKFYLTPQDPSWNSGSIATYIACFDGHKQVYLLGFDGNDDAGYQYNVYAGTTGYDIAKSPQSSDFWTESMVEVFNTYIDVDFVYVSEWGTQWLPDAWKYQLNLRHISYRDFVIEADIG